MIEQNHIDNITLLSCVENSGCQTHLLRREQSFYGLLPAAPFAMTTKRGCESVVLWVASGYAVRNDDKAGLRERGRQTPQSFYGLLPAAPFAMTIRRGCESMGVKSHSPVEKGLVGRDKFCFDKWLVGWGTGGWLISITN